MSFEHAKDHVVALVREHIQLAEPIVFLMGFAEGIPGISLLVPSTPLFLGIGAAHAAAGGQFWHLWLAATFGAICSDLLIYGIGRRCKAQARDVWPLTRHPDWARKGHVFLERWGILAVAGGKFAGPLRPLIPAIAGVLGMPAWQFIPASIFSSLFWAAAFLGPGYGIKWLID